MDIIFLFVLSIAGFIIFIKHLETKEVNPISRILYFVSCLVVSFSNYLIIDKIQLLIK